MKDNIKKRITKLKKKKVGNFYSIEVGGIIMTEFRAKSDDDAVYYANNYISSWPGVELVVILPNY